MTPVRDLGQTFSRQYEALQRAEWERAERETRMRNALITLADLRMKDSGSPRAFAQFVRATAREGLGRG